MKAGSSMIKSATKKTKPTTGINPHIVKWQGSLGLPKFEKISDDDFAPAFENGMAEGLKEIDTIARNTAKPTFKNTIIALELAENTLNRVSAIFWNRAGAHTNETIQKLERDLSPKLSRYGSTISMNKPLFQRIDTLWQKRKKLKLTPEEMRVLERYWKGYVKSGAKLATKQQKQLAKINEQLAGLGTQFGQNLLADEARLGSVSRMRRKWEEFPIS